MTTEDEPTTVISAQVPILLRDQLAQRARAADRTLSAEIRRALVAHTAHSENESETRP
jgi:hypothetical protein